MRRHPVRAIVYGLAAGCVAALLVVAGGGAPGFLPWLANSRLVAGWLLGSGFRYTVRELSPERLNIERISLTRGEELLRLDRLLAGRASLSAEGVRIGSAGRPLLTVRRFEQQRSSGEVSLDDVAASGPELASVGRCTLAGPAGPLRAFRLVTASGLPGDAPVLRVEELTADGISGLGLAEPRVAQLTVRRSVLDIKQRPDGSWNLPALDRLQALADGAARLQAQLLAFARELKARARRLFLALLLAAVVAAFALKLLLTKASITRRVMVALAAVLLPLALYICLSAGLPALSALLICAVAQVAAAIVLYFVVYRKCGEWHHRLEPAALDVLAAIMILPPLAGYLTDVPIPELPVVRTFSVGKVLLADSSGSVSAAAGSAAFSFPAVELENLRLEKRGNGLAAGFDQFRKTGEAAGFVTAAMPGQGSLGRADLSSFSATGLRLGFADFASAPAELELAESRVEGGLAPGPAAGVLEGPPWLPKPGPVHFCSSVAVSARSLPGLPRLRCRPAAKDAAALASSAAVSLRGRALRFRASARLDAPGLHLDMVGAGTSSGLRIARLETREDSRLRLVDGAGDVSWSGGLRAEMNFRQVGARGFSFETVHLDAHTSPRIAGVLRFERGTAASSGMALSLGPADLRFDSSSREFHSTSRLSEAALQIREQGSSEPWLDAQIPLIEIALDADRSPELLPREIAGALSLTVAGRKQPAFRTGRLRFTAGLWQPTVQVPEQELLVEQALSPQLPPALPVSLSATAAPGSFQAALRIPRLELSAARPLEIGIRDFDLRLFSPNPLASPVEVKWASGWSSATLPEMPPALVPAELVQVNLETEGSAGGTKELNALWSGIQTALNGLRPTGTLERTRSFRIEGSTSLPGRALRMRIDDPRGAHQDVQVETRRVVIRDARLSRSELLLEAPGPGGSLLAAVTASAEGEQVALSRRVPSRGSVPLLTIVHNPAAIDLFTTEPVLVSDLADAAAPLAESLGLDARRFRPGGFVQELRLHVPLNQGSGAALTGSLEIRPGPEERLLEVGPLDLLLDAPDPAARVRLAIGGPAESPTVNVDVHGLHLRSGKILETRLDAQARVRLAPYRPDPLFDRIGEAASGLGAHLNHALRVFGTGPPATDLRWKMALRNLVPESSAVSMQPGLIRSSVAAALSRLEWRTGSVFHSVSGRADLRSGVSLGNDGLLIQGDAGVEAALSPRDGPARMQHFSVPFSVLVSERLRPAPAGARELWDTVYYQRLWNRDAAARRLVWSVPVLTFSPLEVEQVALDGPLRAAIGYAGPLQLHLPWNGTFAFGQVRGSVQAGVTWREDSAVLDSLVRLRIGGVQAGALEVDTFTGFLPLLDVPVDGTITWRTERMPFAPRDIATLLADPAGFHGWNNISIDVNLRGSAGGTGVLQLSSDAQLTNLNRLLRSLIRRFQFKYPPRAVTYRGFELYFRANNGLIRTSRELLHLRRLQVLAGDSVRADTDLRVHWGRRGAPDDVPDAYPLDAFVRFLMSNVPPWFEPAKRSTR